MLVVGRETLERLRIDARDLRPNLVVDGVIDALPSGTILRVGDVRIRLTLACESCHLLDRTRPGLARAARGSRGVLGRVITSGTIRLDDAVAVEHRVTPGRAEPSAPRWDGAGYYADT